MSSTKFVDLVRVGDGVGIVGKEKVHTPEGVTDHESERTEVYSKADGVTNEASE